MIGAFSLTADTQGTSGTLGFSAHLGIPTFDPGRNINIAQASGSGTFGPGGYDLRGTFSAALPPIAFAAGKFALNSEHGFSAQGHYVGPLVGPFSLNPGINPTGNVTEDTSYLRLMDALNPNAGGQGPVRMFEPGVGFGYSYFNYSSSGSLVVSVGASSSSAAVPYYPGGVSQPPLPVLWSLGFMVPFVIGGMTGVLMAEPIQKTAGAQENAVAGLELKASHPAQIIRKGVQKRSVRIDYTWRINESFRRYSARVLKR